MHKCVCMCLYERLSESLEIVVTVEIKDDVESSEHAVEW